MSSRRPLATVRISTFDLLFFEFQGLVPADSTGLWDFERFPPAKSQYQPKPATASFITLGKAEGPSSVVIPSLVTVEFFVPFSIDGVHSTVVRHSHFLAVSFVLNFINVNENQKQP